MTITNNTITSAGTSDYYTLDYGMTVDMSTANGSFTLDTTNPLVFDASDAGSYYGTYPSAVTVHISANGTADITYYSAGYVCSGF